MAPTVSNPLTRHPAVAAPAIGTINELPGGRAFLVVGTGDSAILNLGLRPARLAQVRDYLEAVRTALSGLPAEYQGKPMHVKWSQSPVPILMSAEGPRTLALAGGFADGVIVHSGLSGEVLKDTISRI